MDMNTVLMSLAFCLHMMRGNIGDLMAYAATKLQIVADKMWQVGLLHTRKAS